MNNEMNRANEAKEAAGLRKASLRDKYLSIYSAEDIGWWLTESRRWLLRENGRDPKILHKILLARVSQAIWRRDWMLAAFRSYVDMACFGEDCFDYDDEMLFLTSEIIERTYPWAKGLGFAPPLMEEFFHAFRKLLDRLETLAKERFSRRESVFESLQQPVDSTGDLRTGTRDEQARQNAVHDVEDLEERDERIRVLSSGATNLFQMFLRTHLGARDIALRRLYRGYLGEIYQHPGFSKISVFFYVEETRMTRSLLVRRVIEEIAAAKNGGRGCEGIVDLLLAVAFIACPAMDYDYGVAHDGQDLEEKEVYRRFHHSLLDLFELVVEAGTQHKALFREEIQTVFEESIRPKQDHNLDKTSLIRQGIEEETLHWLFRDWLTYIPLEQESAQRLVAGANKLLQADLSAQADFELLDSILDYIELYKTVHNQLPDEVRAPVKEMIDWYAAWAAPYFSLEAEYLLHRAKEI